MVDLRVHCFIHCCLYYVTTATIIYSCHCRRVKRIDLTGRPGADVSCGWEETIISWLYSPVMDANRRLDRRGADDMDECQNYSAGDQLIVLVRGDPRHSAGQARTKA